MIGILCVSVLFVALAAFLLFGGRWKSHARAESPDGSKVAVSKVYYKWGPLYGWNHYYISVHPTSRIACVTPGYYWRGTPTNIVEFKTRHRYAVYNDFDQEERYPASIKWVSSDEFIILGGEGHGAKFRIAGKLSNKELKATGEPAP